MFISTGQFVHDVLPGLMRGRSSFVEKTTGRPIGSGTILELMPPGKGFGPNLPPPDAA